MHNHVLRGARVYTNTRKGEAFHVTTRIAVRSGKEAREFQTRTFLHHWDQGNQERKAKTVGMGYSNGALPSFWLCSF